MKIKPLGSKIIFILAALLLSSDLVHAAGMGMGGPPNPCGGPFPPCPIPLDNGIMLLLFAGLAYGGIKIYQSFRKNPA